MICVNNMGDDAYCGNEGHEEGKEEEGSPRYERMNDK
jgi:hypothetical protein